MGLPWFRLDSHIGSHDKVLALLADPSPKRWQAAFSYVCSIGWSVDQETDGKIPKVALAFVHGTPATARLLVTYRLWSETLAGWNIVNFAKRQEVSAVSELKREDARQSGLKGACRRHHGETCWRNGRCTRAS